MCYLTHPRSRGLLPQGLRVSSSNFGLERRLPPAPHLPGR